MTEALENIYEENQGPSSIHDLEPKMRLEGTITRVELFGAFVDVGVGHNGLVHISQLSEKRVNRVEEVVEEGDQVTVWVLNVEPQRKRIDLTMVEPPAVDWGELRSGQVHTGTVTRLESFGAFVDIGATRDGLVHVSEIASGYIKDPNEYLSVGEEIDVQVLKVDRKRRRIELSIKSLDEEFVAEALEDDLGEMPTEMELAWRQAQRERKRRRGEKRRKKGHSSGGRDDVYSRTLSLREDQD